jgi:hypothetical protein
MDRVRETPPSTNETAAAFAQNAPRAGFLCKLSSVGVMERRFFVLKPSTHLYYFSSPSDTQPRGCLELDGGAGVKMLEKLEDGRVRFSIQLDQLEVVLEARSEEVCRDWMTALKQEQLGYCQQELMRAQQLTIGYRQRISDLDKMVQELRLVEKDKEGALEDAANWKRKYDELNQAVRLLTLYLRRQPKESPATGDKVKGLTGDASDVAITPLTAATTPTTQELSIDESYDEEIDLETLQAPGSHLSALVNACQQLYDNMRFASHEASSALDDVQAALQQKVASERKLAKAEKHLMKLWQDNTALRQELKITKKEKRVLVKEIKGLRSKAAILPQDGPVQEEDVDASTGVDIEGERLFQELEEQVESNIRLHEEFLAKNKLFPSPNLSIPEDEAVNTSAADSGATMRINNSINGGGAGSIASTGRSSPIEPKILSLLDDDTDEEEEDDDNDAESGITSTLSSVGADFGDGASQGALSDSKNHDSVNDIERPWSRMEDDESHRDDSEASKSVVTENGKATSRLTCPLADVVETNNEAYESMEKDGEVYHLTFYSRKIGLQFQKVPPTSSASGVLTEAMTADLPSKGSDKTASELRRIADMTRKAKGYDMSDNSDEAGVAVPLDAVLVCGFHGFDDTANHKRPKLGAHLVAFDGISVELGRWTFESIRKAIQARSRPLTLSFRDDFLTTEQRSILTRAVAEVDNAIPPPQRTIQYRTSSDAPSRSGALMSLHSREPSHESEQFINDFRQGSVGDGDDLSTSSYPYRTFSANTSVVSQDFRSFSQAGSSSVYSSTIGPLVGQLMNGISKSNSDAESRPKYMSRTGVSLEHKPEHHDYRNSLL